MADVDELLAQAREDGVLLIYVSLIDSDSIGLDFICSGDRVRESSDGATLAEALSRLPATTVPPGR